MLYISLPYTVCNLLYEQVGFIYQSTQENPACAYFFFMQLSPVSIALQRRATRQVFYAFRLSFSINVLFDFATCLKLYPPQRTLSGRWQTPLAMMFD